MAFVARPAHGAVRSRVELVQYVEGQRGRARWPKARRSSGSAIAAEVFKNNAGEVRDKLTQHSIRARVFSFQRVRDDDAA